MIECVLNDISVSSEQVENFLIPAVWAIIRKNIEFYNTFKDLGGKLFELI